MCKSNACLVEPTFVHVNSGLKSTVQHSRCGFTLSSAVSDGNAWWHINEQEIFYYYFIESEMAESKLKVTVLWVSQLPSWIHLKTSHKAVGKRIQANAGFAAWWNYGSSQKQKAHIITELHNAMIRKACHVDYLHHIETHYWTRLMICWWFRESP